MEFTILEQFNVLIYSVLVGVMSGLFLDIYRLIYFNISNKIIRITIDFLLCTVGAFCYFIFVLFFCKGKVGIYEILCLAIGIFIYFSICGNITLIISQKIKKAMKKVIKKSNKTQE